LMRLAREICSGLAAVHGQGLIHRDIKPSNVWLEGPDRRVKILDFGLARAVDDDAGITQHGAILGTPAFMSPEQASGARVDARSDLFSLGCLLYCLASGARPFPAENTMATLSALANRTPTPIRELNPEVLPAVAELIGQLLAKSPEERPASAEAVLERLAEIENDPRAANRAAEKRSRALLLTTTGSRRRRWLKAAALLTVVCGLLFGGGYLVQWYYWLFPTKLPFPDPPPGSTFLTEFKPVETENWPFHPYLPPDRANDGVYVQHRYFEKGILTHPAPEPFPDRPLTSGLTYDIAQRFRKLGGMVSVKDMPLGAGSRAPITFSIFGDGKLLWESRPVQFQRDSQQFDVDVAGVKLLKILASTPVGSQPHGAFAVWVEPYLTK
ncbi:MAG: protein kinase, partial [Gemmataceae bacterium]